jgi:hypothetical protein
MLPSLTLGSITNSLSQAVVTLNAHPFDQNIPTDKPISKPTLERALSSLFAIHSKTIKANFVQVDQHKKLIFSKLRPPIPKSRSQHRHVTPYSYLKKIINRLFTENHLLDSSQEKATLPWWKLTALNLIQLIIQLNQIPSSHRMVSTAKIQNTTPKKARSRAKMQIFTLHLPRKAPDTVKAPCRLTPLHTAAALFQMIGLSQKIEDVRFPTIVEQHLLLGKLAQVALILFQKRPNITFQNNNHTSPYWLKLQADQEPIQEESLKLLEEYAGPITPCKVKGSKTTHSSFFLRPSSPIQTKKRPLDNIDSFDCSPILKFDREGQEVRCSLEALQWIGNEVHEALLRGKPEEINWKAWNPKWNYHLGFTATPILFQDSSLEAKPKSWILEAALQAYRTFDYKAKVILPGPVRISLTTIFNAISLEKTEFPRKKQKVDISHSEEPQERTDFCGERLLDQDITLLAELSSFHALIAWKTTFSQNIMKQFQWQLNASFTQLVLENYQLQHYPEVLNLYQSIFKVHYDSLAEISFSTE